ncbi:MAG: hypothetical protein OXG96_12365, partial [Acidobacteria bacterium]|nr:hypothetical protein [Acidobacteriota bacterium]
TAYPGVVACNLCGGMFWVVAVVLAAYYLGQVAWIRDNLEKVVLLIVFLSITPILYEWARHRIRKRAGKSPPSCCSLTPTPTWRKPSFNRTSRQS